MGNRGPYDGSSIADVYPQQKASETTRWSRHKPKIEKKIYAQSVTNKCREFHPQINPTSTVPLCSSLHKNKVTLLLMWPEQLNEIIKSKIRTSINLVSTTNSNLFTNI